MCHDSPVFAPQDPKLGPRKSGSPDAPRASSVFACTKSGLWGADGQKVQTMLHERQRDRGFGVGGGGMGVPEILGGGGLGEVGVFFLSPVGTL